MAILTFFSSFLSYLLPLPISAFSFHFYPNKPQLYWSEFPASLSGCSQLRDAQLSSGFGNNSSLLKICCKFLLWSAGNLVAITAVYGHLICFWLFSLLFDFLKMVQNTNGYFAIPPLPSSKRIVLLKQFKHVLNQSVLTLIMSPLSIGILYNNASLASHLTHTMPVLTVSTL